MKEKISHKEPNDLKEELQFARSREAQPFGAASGSRSGGCHAARMFYKKILGIKKEIFSLSSLSSLWPFSSFS
ncbi:MAG: hypothetical protein NT164_08765 [Verrucomicrobiae bacterium]|nr:hypothetical protein [Verrucomicrobiae bacterium]